MKCYTVCLCWNYQECKVTTEALAKKNGAEEFIVEPVAVKYSRFPAYRGQILL